MADDRPDPSTTDADLVAFALWIHPVWDPDNADDRAEATRAVAAFRRGEPN